MYLPRILTVDSLVSAHLGVNMWSPRPWSSETQWWPHRRGRWRFRCHSGLFSGEARGTHLAVRCCIACWFAKWRWVLVDGPQHWIPSVGAFS
ncbi:uncharacterized protein LACBIDRAFT_314351 [Laccaria bicolor S238N-H82]|uniref:Predicted protein n=1 Tax=Laccaria bicolor (strain S238N-H82 / ATCC MYA-4686) TaxID=486041 RepID=B0DYC8_LACBS|nr:uncharacterized protein LACBIDRAFT_314351 [Laccaria bicolor S238N-H82]EDR00364.1 predicted protein [Laccaria bicolor S238N-H82]|eukprot:XP_001888923.1 predicted protein [Laccaria bicolor S238N-H82]